MTISGARGAATQQTDEADALILSFGGGCEPMDPIDWYKRCFGNGPRPPGTAPFFDWESGRVVYIPTSELRNQRIFGPLRSHLREFIERTGSGEWLEHRGIPCIQLRGGSGFWSVLSADGAVWVYSYGRDPEVEELADGPRKLVEIRLATRRWPELADWLPQRPVGAVDCEACGGLGRPCEIYLPCLSCFGFGWKAQAGTAQPIYVPKSQ